MHLNADIYFRQKLSQIRCISPHLNVVLNKRFLGSSYFIPFSSSDVKSAAIFQARKVVADVWHLSSCFIKNVCALTFGFKTDNRALRIYKFVKPQEKYCFSFFYLYLPKVMKWCWWIMEFLMQQGTILWPNLFSTFEARCWKLESAYPGNFDHVLLLPQLPKPVHVQAFCVNFSLLAQVAQAQKA